MLIFISSTVRTTTFGRQSIVRHSKNLLWRSLPAYQALIRFLYKVLERCRGRPLLRMGQGRWYDWPLERPNCEFKREIWGNRSLIKASGSVFEHTEPDASTTDFPPIVPPTQSELGSQPLLLSTLRRSNIDIFINHDLELMSVIKPTENDHTRLKYSGNRTSRKVT